MNTREWLRVHVWVGRGYGVPPDGPHEGQASVYDKRTGRAIVQTTAALQTSVGESDLFDGVLHTPTWKAGVDTCAYSVIPETRFDRSDPV